MINRLRDDLTTPSLVELRDFTVDGLSYLEISRRNSINDIEPNTIIYDEQTFHNDEFNEKINLPGDTEVLIEKVTICGSVIQAGIVNVNLNFGFDNRVEDFNFQFDVDDIEK
jgi:hypothetical protein